MYENIPWSVKDTSANTSTKAYFIILISVI